VARLAIYWIDGETPTEEQIPEDEQTVDLDSLGEQGQSTCSIEAFLSQEEDKLGEFTFREAKGPEGEDRSSLHNLKKVELQPSLHFLQDQ